MSCYNFEVLWEWSLTFWINNVMYLRYTVSQVIYIYICYVSNFCPVFIDFIFIIKVIMLISSHYLGYNAILIVWLEYLIIFHALSKQLDFYNLSDSVSRQDIIIQFIRFVIIICVFDFRSYIGPFLAYEGTFIVNT